MPALRQFAMPDVGEGLTEGEIIAWHVGPGDTVADGQVIVEVETAKAAVELPSPYDGVVTELLATPGSTVGVGAPIITIETNDDAQPVAQTNGRQPNLVGYGPKTAAVTRRRRVTAAPPAPPQPPTVASPARLAERGRPPVLAKPPVRKYAKDNGIDLSRITGSGPQGSITRADIEAAVSVPAAAAVGAREERIAVRGVRRQTAQAMVASAFTAPHVTEFLTIDITPTMALRDRLAASREFADAKLSPLVFVARAVIMAVRRFPLVNSSWDEASGEIVVKRFVNLGIAAATDRGLVVPNIKDADRLPIRELAGALRDLTETARAGRTTPAALSGGTISITNVGVFGVDTGTPILPPGEAVILAFGSVRDMPWVHEGAVVPRQVTQLAISFDHRIVDGALGSQFLAAVGEVLAAPEMALVRG